MPDYKFRAALRDGRIIRGKIVANSKTQVKDKLKKSKIYPIAIKKMNERKRKSPKKSIGRFESKFNVKPEARIDITKMNIDFRKIDFHPFSKITSRDLIVFVNNLYILKKANFNNIQALQSIYDGTENPAFKDIIEDILIGVEAGERLNKVMMNYPHVFSPMFVNFIRVGEESGSLEASLLHAREYIESSSKLNKQIKSAIIPRVLQFVGIMLGMILMLLFGVPMLEGIYQMFGSTKDIPVATRVAVDITKWILAKWYLFLGGIIALIALFISYVNTPRGRYSWDKLLLTAPVFGQLNKNITVNKFFLAMLLNLKNGMRIQESIEISKNVTENYYFLAVAEAGKSNSLTGNSWIEPFESQKIFNPMITEMLNVGMKTDLTEMISKVADYLKLEIDESIAKFVKALPEISYLFVGIVLIAFLITVVVPIIDVYMGGFIEMPK